MHARAFRRLEAKTQVFSPGISDHFRNRLTHTIEVTQIARTVANALELNEDLTEALALVHDIGHPPFAHSGEIELNRNMRRFGEIFDHNIQALRIVETFEQRYARFPGLNLTFEVREGIVKHSRDLTGGESPQLDEYLPGVRPPLEAQLIDLADEIAYDAADLDDAFAAYLITAEDVAAHVPAYAEIYEAVETQFPGSTESERFQETLRHLIDGMVSSLIDGTAAAARASGAANFEDVRQLPERIAAWTPESAAATREIKQFLRDKVYSSEAIKKDRRDSTAMMSELFEFFLENPGRLPSPHCGLAMEQPVHRVVCDYIAGMTDVFFNRTYTQIFGDGTNPRA